MSKILKIAIILLTRFLSPILGIISMQAGQPRDDYLELLELCIVFLGGEPPRGVRFRLPGPVHSARWMAKAIYVLKMTLFRKQLLPLKIITEKEAKGLLEVAVFLVIVYVKAWYRSPQSIEAPQTDLDQLKSLQKYAIVNNTISRVAENRFLNHLWYLSEVNVGFAVFDERLPDRDRQKIAAAIKVHEGSPGAPPKKRNLASKDVKGLSLAKLCTKNTFKFFNILGIDPSFLEKPVCQWSQMPEYIRGKDIVRHLKVTNDHAERAVKLMADFNRGVTRNEESFQCLLLTVQAHRKSLPNVNKKNLIAKYDK